MVELIWGPNDPSYVFHRWAVWKVTFSLTLFCLFVDKGRGQKWPLALVCGVGAYESLTTSVCSVLWAWMPHLPGGTVCEQSTGLWVQSVSALSLTILAFILLAALDGRKA